MPHRRIAILAAVLLFAFLTLGASSPVRAGGPFRDVLFDAFCKGLPYHERVGCNGYLQYRIQRGKSRDQAINNCNWGCGEVLDDPTKIQDCRKGCRDANAKDN